LRGDEDKKKYSPQRHRGHREEIRGEERFLFQLGPERGPS
jgi:hypothetical protein